MSEWLKPMLRFTIISSDIYIYTPWLAETLGNLVSATRWQWKCKDKWKPSLKTWQNCAGLENNVSKPKNLIHSNPRWNLNKDWSNSCCLGIRQTSLVSANSNGGPKAKDILSLCVCWWCLEFMTVWANQLSFS